MKAAMGSAVEPSAAVGGEPLIALQHVWFAYPGADWALRDVDLTVSAGEYVAIIGANGAGKTTLAKHCNGLLLPTQGQVRVRGQPSADLSPRELASAVGYVFQNPDHQIFAPSIREEVAFGPRNLGLAETEVTERTAEALGRFGLMHVGQRPPAVMSFPVRRVIALASVYAMRPQALILDEPTGGLDGHGVTDVMQAIAELHAVGHTIILITHDMALVAEQAQRVVLLHRGQVLLDASPGDAFADGMGEQRTGLAPPQITRLAQRLWPGEERSRVLTVAQFVSAYMQARSLHSDEPEGSL